MTSQHPYQSLPSEAFWRSGVAQETPFAINQIWKPKFEINRLQKIATAGSCFAQHIMNELKKNNFTVLDLEPAPPGLPDQLHTKYGYSMYSARYGNIYSARQLNQLAKECLGYHQPKGYIWRKNGKFFDGLRPSIEPDGLDNKQQVIEHRQFHIEQVREMFKSLDIFIFTLGLTESWIHRASGTVFPIAPGTQAGRFNPRKHKFYNANFKQIKNDMNQFLSITNEIRGGKPFKMLLTVSPVPLTATASDTHVLVATMQSKALLRSAAAELCSRNLNIDYFPSYEIVNNPRLNSLSFADNLRTIRPEIVATVMRHFFEATGAENKKQSLPIATPSLDSNKIEDVQCEEALLDAFDSNRR